MICPFIYTKRVICQGRRTLFHLLSFPFFMHTDLIVQAAVIRQDSWKAETWTLSRVKRVLKVHPKVGCGSKCQLRLTIKMHRSISMETWWRLSRPIIPCRLVQEFSPSMDTKTWFFLETSKSTLSSTSLKDAREQSNFRGISNSMQITEAGRRMAFVKYRTWMAVGRGTTR